MRALSMVLVMAAAPSLLVAADPEPATGPFTVAGTVADVGLQPVVTAPATVTAITHAGDIRLFVTLQDGRIVIVAGGALRAQPFLDLRGQISTGGERGLLSTAFHPRYAQNGFFFVNYTNPSGDTVIARYRVSGDPERADPASARILLTIAQPFANHNGGQLQFGPDGYLYVGMGDGGSANDPACRAQKGDTLLGKLLRLDVDQNVDTAPFYGIPPDNPFRGPGDPLDEIWASGLRNPWRFSFDRSNGELWIADVGQGQREEVDFQPALSSGGQNYGWKLMEGTQCGGNDACPAGTPACNSSAFTDPVLEYAHQGHCSITGGYVYRGSAVPQLRGAYVFGDLCSGAMWAAFRDGDGSRLVVRSLPVSAPSLTTFGEDAAGELFAATGGGQIFRFVNLGPGPGPQPIDRVGLYEPVPSRFELKQANTRTASVTLVRFGPRNSGWLPIAGDWDGDGDTTVGLYDPDTGTFRLKNSHAGRNADIVLRLQPPTADALPIVGDWDGDGRDGLGFYDTRSPTIPQFQLWNVPVDGAPFDSVMNFFFDEPVPDALPVAGDWDGDGSDEVGLYFPPTGTFLLGGRGPINFLAVTGGGSNALPVAGDWDGDGRDGVGVYDPRAAVFRLRNGLTSGPPDVIFRFGPRRGGWLPIAGAW